MGFFSWLFGADKKEADMSMGTGAHQMQRASTPAAEMPHRSGVYRHSDPTSGAKVVTDPVRGMDVDLETAATTSVFQGTTYVSYGNRTKETLRAVSASSKLNRGQCHRVLQGRVNWQ